MPNPVVYKDKDFKSDVILNSSDRTNNSSDSLNFVGSVDFLRKNGWFFLHIWLVYIFYLLHQMLIDLWLSFESSNQSWSKRSLSWKTREKATYIWWEGKQSTKFACIAWIFCFICRLWFSIHELCANVSSFQMKDPQISFWVDFGSWLMNNCI